MNTDRPYKMKKIIFYNFFNYTMQQNKKIKHRHTLQN